MMRAIQFNSRHLFLVSCVAVLLVLCILLVRLEGNQHHLLSSDKTNSIAPHRTANSSVGVAFKGGKQADHDAAYFDSYAYYHIHWEMLTDKVRTEGYRDAIYDNKHLFKGKVVLDIGCGTGILSMFAARAGAAKVIGIDASGIIDSAMKIIKKNKLDKVITLIKGKVEEISLPAGVDKVDIIVSEWMGYYLFFESMLQTVLFARDKWLVPGGLILPDRAILYISAYYDKTLNWWDSVYDFDMGVMRPSITYAPHVMSVYPKYVVTGASVLKDIDLNTVKSEDLEFSTPFQLVCNKTSHVNSFVTYFDVEFTKCNKKPRITTAPQAPYTHWRQTMFNLDRVDVSAEKGEVIHGTMTMELNKENSRHLDVSIDVEVKGKLRTSQSYYLF